MIFSAGRDEAVRGQARHGCAKITYAVQTAIERSQASLATPKGYYFAVGGTQQAAFDAAAHGGPPVPSHHSPLFKVDPRAVVTTGATAMTAAVLDLLKPGQASAG